MIESIWGYIVEHDLGIGFLILMAFVLGMGINPKSSGIAPRLEKYLNLLEALADHVEKEQKEKRKRETPDNDA